MVLSLRRIKKLEFYLTQNPPLLSIITPSFNRVDMIGLAIDSVLKQDYSPIEHIIIDGGSTDGTLDLLSRYSHLKVVSEPDRGMYDAINKGLKLAQGEIVGFLNSDDLYASDVFAESAAYFVDPKVEAVAGRAEVYRKDKAGNIEILSEIIPSNPDGLLKQVVQGPPGFNAWFFRRNAIDKIGAFDIAYRIGGDREFMIRLALAGIVYVQTDRLIYRYFRHAGAMTYNFDAPNYLEIAHENLKMSEGFLKVAGLSRQARQSFRKQISRVTLNIVVTLLYRRELGKAWFFARQGLRYDWAWPLKFISHGFYRLAYHLNRL